MTPKNSVATNGGAPDRPQFERPRLKLLEGAKPRPEVPERGGGAASFPAQAAATFGVASLTTLGVIAQTVPNLADIWSAGPHHAEAVGLLSLSLMSASMSVLAFQHLQGELRKRQDDARATARDEEVKAQHELLDLVADKQDAQDRKIDQIGDRLEDIMLATQARRPPVPRRASSSSATAWLPDQFKGGVGEVVTLFPAMRAEIRRTIDTDGVLFDLMDTPEPPPSIIRLRRRNGIAKWRIGVCLSPDRRTLLDLAATEFALRSYPRREEERGNSLDLGKLVLDAVLRPSPAYTRVHIPESDGVRVLHYDAWEDERYAKSLLRRLQGDELDASVEELNAFKSDAHRISLRALRYFLGNCIADQDGLLSQRAIENRLNSRSPSLVELIRISAEARFVSSGDHSQFDG